MLSYEKCTYIYLFVLVLRQSLIDDMYQKLQSCGKTIPQVIYDVRPILLSDEGLFMEIMNVLQAIDLEGKFFIRIQQNSF